MEFLERLNYLIDGDYDIHEGVVSTTTLIKPIQMQLLSKRYKGALKQGDRSKARIGTLIHKGMESFMNSDDFIQEQRLFMTINGVKISGKFDAFDLKRRVVIDYKSTSTYTYTSKKYNEYILQLSIYNLLLDANGYQVSNKGEIVLFLTDWKESYVDKYENYPDSAIKVVSFDLMSLANTKAYLEAKLSLEAKYEALSDKELPECTDEELWRDEDTYTVEWFTQTGNLAKYPKKFTDVDEAFKFANSVNNADNKNHVHPVTVKGEAKRCRYCPASDYCEQYKKMNPEEEW